MKLAESNSYEMAQQRIDVAIDEIEQNTRVRKNNMKSLVNDLRKARNNC